MNPLALAMLYPGSGGGPLPPLVLGGPTQLAFSASTGISPRVAGGFAVERGAKRVGWDVGLHGGPDFLRLDSGGWLHAPIGDAGVGVRLGGVAAIDVWGNPWFAGTVAAQVAAPVSDETVLSVSGGAEIVTGIYLEGSFGPTTIGVANARIDTPLSSHWSLGFGVGWPHLVGLTLTGRR